MKEDVGLELADEEDGQRARIGFADHAGADRAREVVGEDADGVTRRDFLVLRIERHDQRGRVHLHRDRGADDGGEERDHAPRELGQHDARIGRGVERQHGRDEIRRGDGAAAHRRVEELLLRIEVAEDRGGRDVDLGGNLRESGGREAARAEVAAGGGEDLIARDARRASHDVSKRRFTNPRLSMGVY